MGLLLAYGREDSVIGTAGYRSRSKR